MQHEADICIPLAMRASMKKFDEMWSANNCATIGEASHIKIKEGGPIVGYMCCFCLFMLHLCKQYENSHGEEKNEEIGTEHRWLHVDGIDKEGTYNVHPRKIGSMELAQSTVVLQSTENE